VNKAIKIIIALVLILALAAGGAYYYISTKIVYNNETAVGNTPGNLNNGGLFCEYEGKIYFANPADQNKLYVMDSDCTNAKKLNDDSVASLNVCGSYIYYVKNNFTEDTIGMIFRGQLFGVYRCSLDGKRKKALYDELSGVISLSGNTLYYQHYDDKTALSLYKVGIDGKNNEKLYDTAYSPSCVQGNRIYFSDDDGKHYICYYDIEADRIVTFYNGNTYMADVEGNYAYFIDLDKNYSLVRLNCSNRTLELLYGESGAKVVNYNVYGNKIFLQVEGDSGQTGLYRMNIDGTQLEKIASGNITNIHCTSQYTFFQYYTKQGVLYRVSTTGANPVVEEITVSK